MYEYLSYVVFSCCVDAMDAVECLMEKTNIQYNNIRGRQQLFLF